MLSSFNWICIFKCYNSLRKLLQQSLKYFQYDAKVCFILFPLFLPHNVFLFRDSFFLSLHKPLLSFLHAFYSLLRYDDLSLIRSFLTLHVVFLLLHEFFSLSQLWKIAKCCSFLPHSLSILTSRFVSPQTYLSLLPSVQDL